MWWGGVGPRKWGERGRERGAEGASRLAATQQQADVGCDEE